MDETIRAIVHFIRQNYNAIISVRKIREFYRIDSLNYSKVNFYWRSLQELEEKGILKRINLKVPKEYRIMNYYKFFNLLHYSYLSNVEIAESLI
jgi:hypothetical protein